jgi:plasmid stabilization system protein ParE
VATYRVRRSLATDRDLELITDFLFETYMGFGEHPDEAFARTEARLTAIEDLMLSLAEQPHRASPRDDVLPGLRMLTRDRVVLYFDIDEAEREVRVLGIFFGGRDHHRAMLSRLARPK